MVVVLVAVSQPRNIYADDVDAGGGNCNDNSKRQCRLR